MKKALALVLALVLALSMAVSAFATLSDVVNLESIEPGEAALIPVVLTDLDTPVLHTYVGGTYYVAIEAPAGKVYSDIAVSATGCASASIVTFDPEVYKVVDNNGTDALTYKVVAYEGGKVVPTTYVNLTYKAAVEAKETLDKADKTTVFKVVCEQNITIVKLVVEHNFTASYKTGDLKVTAKETDLATKKVTNVGAKWSIVNDVIAFGYEAVKEAALYNEDGEALLAGGAGYSIYNTQGTYGSDKQDKVEAVRTAGAYVVPTTSFRAIEGKDLTVAADAGNYVTIKNVAAGQKGVNFAFSKWAKYNEDGYNVVTEARTIAALGLDPTVAYVEFGFYGDQVIKSDFEIVLTPDMNWFELREMFEVELEEEDIVTYYILKDGKVIDSITVDYMTADYNEDIELVIKGSNSTLGWYTIALEVPAEEVETETEANPNTGAESVVGVVAALAVVSLASAAAVSLKK